MQRTPHLLYTASLLALSPLAPGGIEADARDCRSIHVVTSVREIVDCPADREADFCIARTNVVDRSSLLTGRLDYFEDTSKMAKHPQDPSLEMYTGSTAITTEEGRLEFEEYGIFDPASFEFVALAKVKEGTGGLEDYGGTVISSGNAKGTGLIQGTICKR